MISYTCSALPLPKPSPPHLTEFCEQAHEEGIFPVLEMRKVRLRGLR